MYVFLRPQANQRGTLAEFILKFVFFDEKNNALYALHVKRLGWWRRYLSFTHLLHKLQFI